MRAVRVEVIGTEKRVRPYQKRERQNRCELITKTMLLLQNFVLSEISDESEHSESELYYPGELSDAKLLQSPTYSESKERNSTLLTNKKRSSQLSKSQQQANRRSRKQFFRMNCPLINL